MNRPQMTKEEMRIGLGKGWRLCQEEWSTPDEIKWVDELVEEGFAVATPFKYHDNFQCERRYVSRSTGKETR